VNLALPALQRGASIRVPEPNVIMGTEAVQEVLDVAREAGLIVELYAQIVTPSLQDWREEIVRECLRRSADGAFYLATMSFADGEHMKDLLGVLDLLHIKSDISFVVVKPTRLRQLPERYWYLVADPEGLNLSALSELLEYEAFIAALRHIPGVGFKRVDALRRFTKACLKQTIV
jgi:hypothetical protein